jgi:hypothetical protein
MAEFTPDNLSQLLQNVHLKDAGEDRLLYVDLLNFGDYFFPLSDWNVTKAFQRVRGFVSASANSHFKIKVFIDDAVPSIESERKWKTRREKEVRKGTKNMPTSMSRMLGEMFHDCGVDTIYSDEMDCDTTIACFAHADGADILSDDKDLFRYTDASYTLYSDFQIKSKRMFIYPKPRPTGKSLASLPIGPKPAVRSSCLHIENGVYRRGVVTPLVRALQIDAHSILIPLLRARFVRDGVSGPVVETWPVWDSSKEEVAWYYEEVITLQTTVVFLQLLDTPDSAFEFFFSDIEGHKPSSIDKTLWKKHLYGLRSLVYDICSTDASPMYKFWITYEASMGSLRGAKARARPAQAAQRKKG